MCRQLDGFDAIEYYSRLFGLWKVDRNWGERHSDLQVVAGHHKAQIFGEKTTRSTGETFSMLFSREGTNDYVDDER
jgi:hypothetical protein